MLDVLIRQGTVLDGSGAPGVVADVGVRDGCIADVGNLSGAAAAHIVNAAGLIVAPGFIDMHAHDDAVLLADVPYTPKLTQGVTTVVVGNCGLSLAPSANREPSTTPAGLIGFVDWEGISFADYLDALNKRRPIVNVAALVGHGTVRAAVMGFDDRPATDDELDAMQAWVQEAMEAGAFGLSTGLIYPPGCFAETEEIAVLARVVADSGGFYASHIRDEADGVFAAVEEAIAVGERAELPVQISHCKLTGRKNWSQSQGYLDLIEGGRARGIDVAGDVYPYDAGCTQLSALLPPWAHEGGPRSLLRRLHTGQDRERLRRDLAEGVEGWWNPFLAVPADNILLSMCPGAPDLEGQTLSAAADSQGADPIETLFEVLVATKAQAAMVVFAFHDTDIRTFLRHPWIMIGTDGIPVGDRPHPRTYGTFARILGHYVREEGVLDLPEAIRKMTSLPARRLGLKDRGHIQTGHAADLVAFDPLVIRDRATYLDPAQPPAGIHYIWVNGVLALHDGQPTGEQAGRAFRHGS